MTPEQLQQFEEMLRQVAEIYKWMQERKVQAIPYPCDEASKTSLGVPLGAGAGSHSLTQVAVANLVSGNVTVPAAYAGTILISIDGVTYELPYIQTV